MIVGSKCQSKIFQLQIDREFAYDAKNMQTSERAEFCTVNDTAISPPPRTMVALRLKKDLSLFPFSNKTHIDCGLKELKGPVKAYHLCGSNCLNMIAILILL